MTANDFLAGQPPPTPEQVAWVFHLLNQHSQEGGSFRHLIYERMGFDEAAYGVLMGQGMALSNLLNAARDSGEVQKALLEGCL